MFTAGIKAEKAIIVEEGKIAEVKLTEIAGKRPLPSDKADEFVGFVTAYADDIIQKWVDFFVYGKKVKAKVIQRKVR